MHKSTAKPAPEDKFVFPTKRLFRGLPVEDATRPLHIRPNKEDNDGAIVGDPENCPLARCLKRTHTAEEVYIFKTKAYVLMKAPDGSEKWLRYNLSKDAFKDRTKFDLHREAIIKGVAFNPPSVSERLNGTQGAKTKNPVNRGSKPKRPKPTHAALHQRDGSGLVKFIRIAAPKIETRGQSDQRKQTATNTAPVQKGRKPKNNR